MAAPQHEHQWREQDGSVHVCRDCSADWDDVIREDLALCLGDWQDALGTVARLERENAALRQMLAQITGYFERHVSPFECEAEIAAAHALLESVPPPAGGNAHA